MAWVIGENDNKMVKSDRGLFWADNELIFGTLDFDALAGFKTGFCEPVAAGWSIIMSQNQSLQQKENNELDPEPIRQFLDHQQKKLHLEERRFLTEEKRLEQDGRLAEKSMDLNGQLLKDGPAQYTRILGWKVYGKVK